MSKKKNVKKLLGTSLINLSLLGISAIIDTNTKFGTVTTSAASNGWQLKGGQYTYLVNDTKQTGWQKVGDVWYYLDVNGIMKTGWQNVGGTWYYLDASGAMHTNWQNIGGSWYYLNSSGAMVTNWQLIGNVWYYFDGSGLMKTGWQKIGNNWYLLDANGVMKTGWQKVGDFWYLLDASGAMVTGWQNLGTQWYYFDGSGVMQAGWFKAGGKDYYSNGNGEMQTGWLYQGGVWYLLDGSGAMATGHQIVGSHTYFFKDGGGMTTNAWQSIDGKWYKYDGNGYEVHGWYTEGGTKYYLTTNGAATGTFNVPNEGVNIFDKDGRWLRKNVKPTENKTPDKPTENKKTDKPTENKKPDKTVENKKTDKTVENKKPDEYVENKHPEEMKATISNSSRQREIMMEEFDRLLNEYRAKEGRAPIKRFSELQSLAETRANEVSKYFEHKHINGATSGDMVTIAIKKGILPNKYIEGYENIGILPGIADNSGKDAAMMILQNWKSSPIHDTALLSDTTGYIFSNGTSSSLTGTPTRTDHGNLQLHGNDFEAKGIDSFVFYTVDKSLW